MNQNLIWFDPMSFSTRFLKLRKDNNLTQQQMADLIDINITQVKRYEAGTALPSVDILKKIATSFHVTTDWLIFDAQERELPDNLKLKLEAINQMSDEDQKAIQALLDGMILKHTATQLAATGTG